MAVLGLRFCARAFSSCGEWGPLFITVRRPLTVAASLVAEHKLQTRRLSSCGSRAQLLRSMWDPPRPGLEPVSPALAGRFSTTVPPGKPSPYLILKNDSRSMSMQSILRPLCMRSWSAGVYRLQFKKYIVGDGNLIGTVWFLGSLLYLMLFMQSALCHLKRPSFLPISITPVKLQDQGPQISCWLKCLIWLQCGSNSQNHPVQVHYLLESDKGKLILAKHPTICEVTENFFI